MSDKFCNAAGGSPSPPGGCLPHSNSSPHGQNSSVRGWEDQPASFLFTFPVAATTRKGSAGNHHQRLSLAQARKTYQVVTHTKQTQPSKPPNPKLPVLFRPLLPPPQVFERVRSGEEDLHAVAEGCLSLLRELITRSTAPTVGGAVGGRGRASRSRKSGRFYGDAAMGASTPKRLLDSSGRRSLSEGLRGAFPLLLETDAYSLVQVRGRGRGPVSPWVVCAQSGMSWVSSPWL